MIYARFATAGELGLGVYYVEKEKLNIYSAGHVECSYAMVEDERCFGIVQFYTGYGPRHIAGMSVIVFSEEDRGQGKGKMAVADAIVQFLSFTPCINRIEVYTEVDNKAACKGAEALGFELEGVLKAWYPRNGKFKDAALYAKCK